MNQLMRHNKAEAELNAYLAAPEGAPQTPTVTLPASVYHEALAAALIALVEAQEAANEQARIANLIALAALQSDHDQDEIVRAEALYSLIQSVPHGMDDEHSEIRPDIARALQIGGAE